MGILDNLADRHFATVESGRLVVLPRGPKRPGYFVDSADENKIRSLVKIYVVAALLIQGIGSTASIAITQSLAFDRHSATLAHQLKVGLVVYAIASTLLYFGPAVLLWNVYRRAVDGICSSLTSVDRASVRLEPLRSARPWRVLLALLAVLLVVMGAILALASYRGH